jgi:pyroglutamyl-peptidase
MRITLTGFGVFPGVTENPTELIIKSLQEKNSSIASDYHVLKVSVEDVLEYCSSQTLPTHEDANDQQPHLIIHLGVNSSIDCMNFERCAYNNMTFRVQDESGYQPENQCINSDIPLDESLQTDFNLDLVLDKMRNTYPCNISTNPGRYLCNYIYFQSLTRAQQCGAPKYILFLHVPSLHVMSLDDQIKFIELSIPLLAEQAQAAAAAVNANDCG